MRRLRTGWLTCLSTIALLIWFAVAELALSSQPAFAQQDRPFTLFDLLFGRRQQAQPENPAPVRPKPRSRGSSAGGAGPAAQATLPSTEKLENARVILVVGDFTAGGLADGLVQAFANSPGVRVVDRSNGSSGFVRDDYFDWPGQIKAILDEEKPAVVAVMIGSNDRQQIKVGGNKEAAHTPAWTTEYTRRVQAFADIIHKDGYPFVWVGQPPYQWNSMSTDMLAFNDIYRAATEKDDGTFVDIWDGFVDDSGNFATSGFDINGQTVRLRANDGINFTKAAKRKIAFYAEKPLRQILGDAAAPDITSLSPEGLPTSPATPQTAPEVQRIPPISLNDPSLDGADHLFGATTTAPASVEKSVRDKLVQDGIPPTPQPGRIDDFAWPPRAYTASKTDEAPTGALGRN